MQVIEEETNLLLAILKVDKSNLNQEEQERRGKSCTSLKPEAAISTPRGIRQQASSMSQARGIILV